MDDYQEIYQAIHNLELELSADTPNVKDELVKIHKELRDRPELAHILTDEQVKTIVLGLSIRTATDLVAAARPAKKAAPVKARLSLDVDGNILI